MKRNGIMVGIALSMLLAGGSAARAADEWKFGIGTGMSSFSLDGDIGFPTGMGGVILDVDLDNGETSDYFESGFGFMGFAAKGKWTILLSAGRVTLEDESGPLTAEWDKDQLDLAGVYRFAQTGKHSWGALFGVRSIGHDWTLKTGMGSFNVDESWTDGVVGVTHSLPFAEKWAWTNRLDAGFGESESSTNFLTAINWQAFEHWSFNVNIRATSVEFGEASDSAKPDFYLYDIDETAVGIGFLYTF